MFVYFNPQSGKMIGYNEVYADIDTTDLEEGIVDKDVSKIVYWMPNWIPEPIMLDDGLTWVDNELRYITEKETGWVELIPETEKLAERLNNYKSLKTDQSLSIVNNKISEITNGINIGYIVAMKDIAEKILKNNANTVELKIYEIQGNIMNNRKTSRQIAKDNINEINEKLKKIGSVYAHYEKLVVDMSQADLMEDIDQLTRTFRSTLKYLISN